MGGNAEVGVSADYFSVHERDTLHTGDRESVPVQYKIYLGAGEGSSIGLHAIARFIRRINDSILEDLFYQLVHLLWEHVESNTDTCL